MKIRKIRFDEADQYFVDSQPYRFVFDDESHAYFKRENGTDLIERFSWIELHSLVGGPRWECKRRPATVEASRQEVDPFFCIWEMSETQQALLLNRSFFVTGLRKLHANGQLKLTPESVAQNYSKIHDEASRAWAAFWGDFGKHYFSSKPKRFAFDASGSSILRWNRLFTRSGERLDSLRDNRGQTSKLDIDQESYQFIMRILREYLLEERFSATATAEKAVLALKIENEKRTKNGQRLLETRSKSTLCEWITRLSPFEVKAGRHGLKAAKEEFAGVGKTDAATRPGQNFEVDEWEIDALSLVGGSVFREGMDAEMLSMLPTGRRWLYVVIDVATRYVVGVVVASSQNSTSAIRALEMATRDKCDLARAAGSPHEWHGFPFEAVRSDTGSAFRAKATQRAVAEILATYIFPIVGEPGFRPYIERFFRTISLKAMPYFPGQTFANIRERGDYDSEAKAVLTDDQLALIFIRFFWTFTIKRPTAGC